MITKGIIESKSSANKYLVRIPILSNSSIGKSNIEISKIEATVCYESGNYNEYKNGDVVFVAFEDNTYSQPVILGKLYIGVDSKESNLMQASNLVVFDSAKLPKSITIGDYTYKDFEGMFNYMEVLSNASQTIPITPETSTDHATLLNLDYDNSGHTGFASQNELQNYAKQTELPGTLSNSEIENILKS